MQITYCFDAVLPHLFPPSHGEKGPDKSGRCICMKALKKLFPMLKTRETVLGEIRANPLLHRTFLTYPENQRDRFLDICTGARGMRLTYDVYFKYIFDTELHRDRLEKLLSCLLGMHVTIREMLPIESICVGSDQTLIAMDIVVELSDGSIANVEIQKIGYRFPGERAACYAADLLLRQYKRVRDKNRSNGKKMSYREMRPVYTIIFYEDSPKEFHAEAYRDTYLHHVSAKSDTGIELNLLQHFIFINLDNFRRVYENRGLEGELDAWLAFLTCDRPEDILRLIKAHPYFTELYEDLYCMASDTEKVMSMFSKELQELDEGTVQLMIDEYQETITQLAGQVSQQTAQIDQQTAQIDQQAAQIIALTAEIENLKKALNHMNTE